VPRASNDASNEYISLLAVGETSWVGEDSLWGDMPLPSNPHEEKITILGVAELGV
jgi:hypothetical protein